MRTLPVVLSAVLCAAPALAAPAKKHEARSAAKSAAKAYRPGFSKIMIVIFENTNYPDALKQPFFKRFAATGALLTNYHGIAHPSQPNYVALAAGDTMGVIDDGHYDIAGRSLANLLAAKGLSWGVYAENLRGVCAKADKQGLYRRKHEPFISFKDVQSNPGLCARIKPASALSGDIQAGRLPDYSLFIPNMNDDGHDTSVKYADKWFRRRFGPILADKGLMKKLVVVATFDEDHKTQENRIYTALHGAGVRPGARSDVRYDHYSLVRTVEDAFGLGTLGREDAKASPIEGIWRTR